MRKHWSGTVLRNIFCSLSVYSDGSSYLVFVSWATPEKYVRAASLRNALFYQSLSHLIQYARDLIHQECSQLKYSFVFIFPSSQGPRIRPLHMSVRRNTQSTARGYWVTCTCSLRTGRWSHVDVVSLGFYLNQWSVMQSSFSCTILYGI